MTVAKRMCGIYEVRNEKGELVARGWKEDVAIVLGCKPSYVSSYALHDRLYKNKFQIKIVDKADRDVEYNFKEREKEKPIPDYILINIIKHGNVSLPDGDPKKYLDYLSEHGYKCRVRKSIIVNGKGKKEPYYIAEVIK